MMQTATYISDAPQMNLFANNTIADKFAAFHNANPRVYMLFEKFALDLLRTGRTRIGAKMIMERVRWECFTGNKDDAGYKINNNFISHYSRLFINNNPIYKDCFETRVLKTP